MKFALTVFLLVAAVISLSTVDAKENKHHTHGSGNNDTSAAESRREKRQSEDDAGHDGHRRHTHHHQHSEDNDGNTDLNEGGFSVIGGSMPNSEDVADAVDTFMEKGQELMNKSLSGIKNLFGGGN